MKGNLIRAIAHAYSYPGHFISRGSGRAFNEQPNGSSINDVHTEDGEGLVEVREASKGRLRENTDKGREKWS